MREWNVPRSALTPVLTTGMVGMMFGGFHRRLRRRSTRPPRRAARQRDVLRRADAHGAASPTGPSRSPCSVPGRPRSRRRDAERRGALVRVRAEAASAVRRDAHDRLHPARRLARRLRRRPDPAAVRLARAVPGLRPAAAGAGRRAAEGRCPNRRAIWPGSKERWPELRALLRRLGHAVSADAAFVDASEKAVGGGERVGRHAVRARISVATRWRSAARSSSAC